MFSVYILLLLFGVAVDSTESVLLIQIIFFSSSHSKIIQYSTSTSDHPDPFAEWMRNSNKWCAKIEPVRIHSLIGVTPHLELTTNMCDENDLILWR